MEIIDAQIHGVDPVTKWGDGVSHDDVIAASAELAIASMDAVGVHGALMNWWPDYVTGYVSRYPGRFAGVPFWGWPQPEPENAEQAVAELAATEGIVGTRLCVGMPNDGSRGRMLNDGAFDAYFNASERHRLPVFVLAHGFLPDLHAAIRSHPDLVFLIDHVGLNFPVRDQVAWPGLFDEVPDVVALAELPNVVIKFTAVPSLSAEPYPFADVWPHMLKIIDAFGVDRMMWGSDITRCRAMHTYRESVDFLLLSDQVAESDKEMMFSGTVRRWLEWPK